MNYLNYELSIIYMHLLWHAPGSDKVNKFYYMSTGIHDRPIDADHCDFYVICEFGMN